ncbi:unnamed protein product [Protopolystoma xenopodis]|uniref:Uncharacterized protein n=1 Tax=Protopolystoma xenopodis TaxID=117903 RepID=A0A3S4ZRA5_9PLAT|nr:unnamed protein product [Protopolystoma xenopodis]
MRLMIFRHSRLITFIIISLMGGFFLLIYYEKNLSATDQEPKLVAGKPNPAIFMPYAPLLFKPPLKIPHDPKDVGQKSVNLRVQDVQSNQMKIPVGQELEHTAHVSKSPDMKHKDPESKLSMKILNANLSASIVQPNLGDNKGNRGVLDTPQQVEADSEFDYLRPLEPPEMSNADSRGPGKHKDDVMLLPLSKPNPLATSPYTFIRIIVTYQKPFYKFSIH